MRFSGSQLLHRTRPYKLGRLRFESNRAMQRKRDFSSPLPMFMVTRMITPSETEQERR